MAMSAETAAWISAGAAVLQAIGAIGAIGATVVLARQSAAREQQANDAAERRAETADRRAAERIAEADRASHERAERQRIEAHNSIIDRFTALARVVQIDIDEQSAKEHQSYGGSLGLISGSYGSRPLANLMQSLPDLRRETDDGALLLSFANLEEVASTLRYEGQGYAAYEVARDAKLAFLKQAFTDVEGHRRPLPTQ